MVRDSVLFTVLTIICTSSALDCIGQEATVYTSIVATTPGIKRRCADGDINYSLLQQLVANKFNTYWRYLNFTSGTPDQYPKLEIEIQERTDTRLWFRLWREKNVSLAYVDRWDWIFVAPDKALPACGEDFRETFAVRVEEFLQSQKAEALGLALRTIPLGTAVFPLSTTSRKKEATAFSVLPLEWQKASELANSTFEIDFVGKTEGGGGRAYSKGTGQCAPFGSSPPKMGILVLHREWERFGANRTPIDPRNPPAALTTLRPIQFFLTSLEKGAGVCADGHLYRTAQEPTP
jgi:hypothetical protein